jgi:hypothetical protein
VVVLHVVLIQLQWLVVVLLDNIVLQWLVVLLVVVLVIVLQ